MDLLNCYSDSEDEEENKGLGKLKSSSAAANANGEFPSASQSKKTRTLDISILPLEIQTALVQGDTMYDSDDEAPSQVVRPKLAKRSEPSTASALSSLLPTPVNPLPLPVGPHKSTSSAPPLVASSKQNSSADTVNLSLFTMEVQSSTRSNWSAASKRVTANPGASSSSHPLQTDDSLVESDGDVDVFQSQSDSTSHKRKRDRDLEQMLLSGDLTSISKFGEVREVVGIDGSNSLKYARERKAKQEMMESLGLTDLSNVAPPSKAQTKKHQINTLALQAAKMELQYLDAKGARMKTKFETQSKYGW